MKHSISTASRSVCQWRADEIEKLRELAPRRVEKDDLVELFPGRTIAAVKVKLSGERRALGITRPRCFKALLETQTRADDHFPMLDPDDPGERCEYPQKWAAKAASSNARFLAALGIAG